MPISNYPPTKFIFFLFCYFASHNTYVRKTSAHITSEVFVLFLISQAIIQKLFNLYLQKVIVASTSTATCLLLVAAIAGSVLWLLRRRRQRAAPSVRRALRSSTLRRGNSLEWTTYFPSADSVGLTLENPWVRAIFFLYYSLPASFQSLFS